MLAKIEGRVGRLEIARVLDTYLLGETAQHWFPDFDRDQLRPHEHWLAPTHYDPETGRIPMPVQSFVVQAQRRVILIDTCIGNHKERPGIAEMHRLSTRYLERLQDLGLRPEDVDYVMCTHLHVDHVGWNTILENGRWRPTFPNARYLMSRADYEAANAEARTPTAFAASRNAFNDSISPVVEAGQVEFVEGVHEFLDEFTLRPAPGHSPGHLRIEMRSAGEIGVFAGDLLHSPLQVPLWQWSSIVCADRAQAAASRRALLEFCASEGSLLIPGHFEAPHVGRIRDRHGAFSVKFGW